MANIYGLPLKSMIVVDQDNHTQLERFSIISNQKTHLFFFFNDFTELDGSSFRIIVYSLNRYLNWDSSRIEGFFGLLKANYGHERGKITTVINNLNNFCSVVKTQSYTSQNKITNMFSKFPLIPNK